MYKFDGLDEACIGVILTGSNSRLVYNYRTIINMLMKDGMTEEEAEEFADFNIVSLTVGENMPVILIPRDADESVDNFAEFYGLGEDDAA